MTQSTALYLLAIANAIDIEATLISTGTQKDRLMILSERISEVADALDSPPTIPREMVEENPGNPVARTDSRPDWDTYFLDIARAVSARSDCERDKVGAVVVKAHRIRATGYNGAPAGKPGCTFCPRRSSGVASGSNYDNCVAVHAEANALLYCDREDLEGATLYITRAPCTTCRKLIEGAGVVRVVHREGTISYEGLR